KMEAARSEAVRSAMVYLSQARAEAARASMDLIRHARSRLRDYYLDQASEAIATAQHEQAVAQRAVAADAQAATMRANAAQAEMEGIATLLADIDRVAANKAGSRA